MEANGALEQLALLHPDRVQVELVAGVPRRTVTGPKGEQSRHGPEDIVHIPALSSKRPRLTGAPVSPVIRSRGRTIAHSMRRETVSRLRRETPVRMPSALDQKTIERFADVANGDPCTLHEAALTGVSGRILRVRHSA